MQLETCPLESRLPIYLFLIVERNKTRLGHSNVFFHRGNFSQELDILWILIIYCIQSFPYFILNASLIPELYKILCKKAAGGREFRIQIFIITVIYLNDNIIGHDIKQRLYFFSDFFKLIMGSIVWFDICLCEYQHRWAGHKPENLLQMCAAEAKPNRQTWLRLQNCVRENYSLPAATRFC